jgi:hypothetical protein
MLERQPVFSSSSRKRAVVLLILFSLCVSWRARCETLAEANRDEAGATCPVTDHFENWFQRVAETQAEQPHWAPASGDKLAVSARGAPV